MVSPESPQVGDLVTFTYSNNGSPCYRPGNEGYSEVYPDATDANTLGNPATYVSGADAETGELSDGAIWTHTYNQAGTYQVYFECDDTQQPQPCVNCGSENKKPESKALQPPVFIRALTISPAASVPTMSEWGLIILGIALLTLGIVSIHTRRVKTVVERN